MPQLDLRQLKQQLKEEAFERSYFVFGEENYLKQFYVDLISKKCVTPGMEGFNLKKFDATEGDSFDEVKDASELLPAFGGYSCIVAKDFPLDTIYAGDKDGFSSFVKDLPESTVVVFWQDTVAVDLKKNAKYKSVAGIFEKFGATLCFDRLDRASLIRMIMTGVSKRGCEIDKNTAAYLIENSGDDLTVLQNETDKLCNLKKDGTILPADIDSVSIKSLEANVFDLSRAITKNDGKKAFAILQNLFSEKEKPELILGTLIMVYVDMYRAKLAVSAGEKSDYAAQFYNYRNREFRLRNAARDCRDLSISDLRKNLDVLNAADKKLKVRVTDEKIILEKLLVELLRSE